MKFSSFVRLVKVMLVSQLDHEIQEVEPVLVNVNQPHLHVVDRELLLLVVVQVLVCGDFTPKIHQV